MAQLEDVYARLQKSKTRRRELMKMTKDELSHNQQYQELLEEMKKLREEKKAIEQDVRMHNPIPSYSRMSLSTCTRKGKMSKLLIQMITVTFRCFA